MVVRASEPGLRVRLGEQHGRGAEAAAQVRALAAGPQLGHHAVQRGQPVRHQVRDVARAEELLAADEHVLVVLVPAHALAGAEVIGDAVVGLEHAQRQHERARRVHGAVGVGQHEGLLLGQRVAVAGRVVLHVAAGRLAAQPLRDVPRVGAGPRGELPGRGRPADQRLVQAELVPDHRSAGRDRRAEVADELPDELIQLGLVQSHGGIAPSPCPGRIVPVSATLAWPVAVPLQPSLQDGRFRIWSTPANGVTLITSETLEAQGDPRAGQGGA